MLLINTIALAAVSLHKEYDDVRLVFSRNNTIVHTGGKRFNVYAAFALAGGLMAIGNAWMGFLPGNLINTIYKRGGGYTQYGVMTVSLPVLHAACLLGIFKVYDAWAVFACVATVVLSLVVVADTNTANSPCTQIKQGFILIIMYASFWAFALFTSSGGFHPLPVVMLLLLFLVMVLVRCWRHSTKPDRMQPLYTEAVTIQSTFAIHAIPPWIWVVTTNDESYSPVITWSAMFIIAVLTIILFAWAIANVGRLDTSAVEDPTETYKTNLLDDHDQGEHREPSSLVAIDETDPYAGDETIIVAD